MDYLPNFCIIDTETTGTNPLRDRVIEIAILRVEKGKIVQQFNSLVNPHLPLHPKITEITGIYPEQLIHAPTFEEIKSEVKEILADTCFVAHNARFDYAFLKNEFKRYQEAFSFKTVCTVKLARQLYPNLSRYNLDTLIKHFEINCNNRHRALDDSIAVYEFLQKTGIIHSPDKISQAWDDMLKKPSLPQKLKSFDIESLPEEPGVYIFWAGETALYVGKSKNIRQRVKSHFINDHSTPKDLKISKQVDRIEVLQTAGELGALLKESQLVKELSPLYNRMLRRNKYPVTLLKDNCEEYFTVKINTDGFESLKTDDVLAVCKSKKESRELLYQLAKDHQLCPKLLNLENGTGRCFFNQIGKCNGACVNGESPIKYNVRFIEAFSRYKIKKWPFDSPILVKETNGELVDVHLVDNWKLLASLNQDGEVTDYFNANSFDFDMYKILRKFILTKNSNLSIEPIHPDRIDELIDNQVSSIKSF